MPHTFIRYSRYFFTLAFLNLWHSSFAQDYSWWNTKHQWDGHSHWTQYLQLSPKFVGPNALPVPVVNSGTINNSTSLNTSIEFHQGNGNSTINPITQLNVVISKKVSLSGWVVPIEYYQMDTNYRDLIASRDYDGKGFAGGDIYLTTQIQVLEESEKRPALMLSINLRSASGTNLEAVRYSDTPGYYFHLATGKNFGASEKTHFRWFAQAGAYIWQTYQNAHRQDDAFLYGLGISFHAKKWEISHSWGGYYGYINNGDRPLVGRLELKTSLDKPLNYSVQVQKGFHDYPFQSVRFSTIWTPSKVFGKTINAPSE